MGALGATHFLWFWCIHGRVIEARDSLRDLSYARAIAHSCF